MAVRTRYNDTDNTHVLIEFESEWNWAEFYRAMNDVQQLVNDNDHALPVILDFSQTDHTPRGLLVRLSTMTDDLPADSKIYFVGLNATMLVFLRALRRSSDALATRASVLHDLQAALRDIHTGGSIPTAYLA